MRTLFLIIAIGFSVSASGQKVMLKNAKDSLAYTLGVLVGENFKKEGYDAIPIDIFVKAMSAAIKGEELLLSRPQCETYVQAESQNIKMKQYEVNKEAGQKFLAANKNKEGVIALDNGLQYEVIRMGDGAKPKATDEVIVHYHGTLIDGTVFDSSVDRGESISFPLNRVIKGWTEILQLMPVGSKWRVYIPYDLAYGDRAAGAVIAPYSALIFEIDLLGIK